MSRQFSPWTLAAQQRAMGFEGLLRTISDKARRNLEVPVKQRCEVSGWDGAPCGSMDGFWDWGIGTAKHGNVYEDHAEIPRRPRHALGLAEMIIYRDTWRMADAQPETQT